MAGHSSWLVSISNAKLKRKRDPKWREREKIHTHKPSPSNSIELIYENLYSFRIDHRHSR